MLIYRILNLIETKQMTMTKIAIDTNILIYCHLQEDECKRNVAHELLARVPVVSSQVVSEYLNVMKRLLKMSKIEILELCYQWMNHCHLKNVDRNTVKLAQQLIKKYDFQIFDAIIVSAALETGCKTLYSEDMHNGLVVEKQLTIINPFL